jgi:hypothetical protein
MLLGHGFASITDYEQVMTRALQREDDKQAHWGGFLEATLLTQATCAEIACLLTRSVEGGITAPGLNMARFICTL